MNAPRILQAKALWIGLAIAGVAAVAAIRFGFAGGATSGTGGSIFSSRGELNPQILEVVAEYSRKNSHLPVAQGAIVNTTYGVTRDITYDGRKVVSRSSGGEVYCVGLVFDVYMAACEKKKGSRFRLPGVKSADMVQFRRDWYGVDGNERTFVRTLVDRELGVEIENPRDAKPGDLIQFWRQKSGHSVVFLDWARDERGAIKGIRYWSAGQQYGIGENTELFEGRGGSIDPDRVFIVRAML